MIFSSRYDIRDKVTAGSIVAVLISVTLFMMPYLQSSIRNNRVFGLGVVCLAVMSLLMLRHSLTGAILLGYVTLSLWLSASETMGSAMYQILCLSGLFLLASSTYPRWSQHKHWIYNTVCIIALANVAAQVIQLCGVSFPRGLLPYDQYGFVGLTGMVNEISALLAICLPFFFRKRYAWAIPAIVAGLVMARTTNGIIAAAVVSCIWLCMRFGKLALTVIPALVLLGSVYLFAFDPINLPNQLQGRGLVYKVTVQATTVKPFGWGFGQADLVIPLLTHTGKLIERGGREGGAFVNYLLQNVGDIKALDRATVKISGQTDPKKIRDYLMAPANNTVSMFTQVHNDYLEFCFATGFMGLALLLAFLWRSLVRGFRKLDTIPAYALVASALTAGLFFSWQIIPIAALTVLSLVMINSKEAIE